jgi:UDP-N-acetylmuramoyl-L-alanyl-D-glutamate--2,6-diaminopimelate ligase
MATGGSARTKLLAQLGLTARSNAEVRITGLAIDSRAVKQGFLFAALPGTTVHGAQFIKYALRQGAAAILTDAEGVRIAKSELAKAGVAVVVAEDPRQALAYAAALWYGAQPEVMVAVTGTNGKTSVASFVRQIWSAIGYSAINIGTTGVEGAWQAQLSRTTPDPLTLHDMLFQAANAGVTHAAMEASSHGLAQMRMDGVGLVAAGFTNFTQDHLDYHKDFGEYFAAKAGLFRRVLGDDGLAVINMDDARGVDMAAVAEMSGHAVIRVGHNPVNDLVIISQRFDATGQDLRFVWEGGAHQVRLDLIGGFQAENVMLATGLCIAGGADPEAVFGVLPQLETVRGRMQRVAVRDNGAAVFVDYAHTPDAIATAIQALRPHVMGRLVVIIGAGGDRDATKRPLMGAAAAAHADVVFVTDDNPRSEDPALIRAAILLACPKATEVADRAEAILRGVDALGPGDTLLIAGKGHETGQIVGDQIFPFDDAEQASVAVAALDGRLA